MCAHCEPVTAGNESGHADGYLRRVKIEAADELFPKAFRAELPDIGGRRWLPTYVLCGGFVANVPGS